MLTQCLRSVALVCCAIFFGCGQSSTDDNATASNPSNEAGQHDDPHDVPLTDAEIDTLREDTATWVAAIEHIQNYRDTIKTETAGETPANAHRSLDLLDYVLQWLPDVAQNSNVPKEDWQVIGENSQKLRDLFNRVHANIDDGKAPDYESVAADIDDSVDALAAVRAGDSGGEDNPE